MDTGSRGSSFTKAAGTLGRPLCAVLLTVLVYLYYKQSVSNPLKEPLFYFTLPWLMVLGFLWIRFWARILHALRRTPLPRETARQILIFNTACALLILYTALRSFPAVTLCFALWILLEAVFFLIPAGPASRPGGAADLKPVLGWAASLVLWFVMTGIALQAFIFLYYFPRSEKVLDMDGLSTQRPVKVLEARRGFAAGFRDHITLPLDLPESGKIMLSCVVSGAKVPFPVSYAVSLRGPDDHEREGLSSRFVPKAGYPSSRAGWREFEFPDPPEGGGRITLQFRTDLCPGLPARLANLGRLIFYALNQGRAKEDRAYRMHWAPLIVKRTGPAPDVNILLLDIDTLRADYLGCYGFPGDISPCIDRVAGEGVLFRTVYSPATWTLPSTVSLLTSLHVDSHRLFNQRQQLYNWPFPSLADYLRDKGFLTLGAVDGGYVSAEFGFASGFHRYWEKRETASPINHAFTRAADQVEQFRDQPFFLFLQTFIVHDYFHLTADYTAETSRRRPGPLKEKGYLMYVRDFYSGRQADALTDEDYRYLKDLYTAGVRITDVYVGRLISQLRMLGIYDKTWIIITSDHGEGFGEIHNGGRFRSLTHGRPPYENQIRIPLIMKFPKSWGMTRGRLITRKVNAVDILPTILDFLGHELPPAIQGRSLKPLIENSGGPWESPTLSGDPVFGFAYVDEKGFKLIKRILKRGPASMEVYDLNRDPGERDALQESTAAAGLRRSLEAIQARSKKLHGGRKMETAEKISPGLKARLEELGYIQ
jgi:arylsulfatase A-like enzyme